MSNNHSGGKRFFLTIIEPVPNRPFYYKCRCDCGKIKEIYYYNIRNGGTISCGCNINKKRHNNNYKHGACKNKELEPLYKIWKSMRQRCNDKNSSAYKNYGGRGINVCDEWKYNFQQFKTDMGDAYKPGLTIDRINNNLGYSKKNCRWVSPEENANNRRSNKYIKYKNKTKTQAQWEKELGFRKGLLCQRIKVCGWTIEKAITTPYTYKPKCTNNPVAREALVQVIRSAMRGD